LSTGEFTEHFRLAGYQKDLERRPPGMVEPGNFYTPAQKEALAAYLDRESFQYAWQQIPDTKFAVLVKTNRPPPETR
jgi:hypothetical protein